MKKLIKFLTMLLLSGQVHAGNFALDNISQVEIDNLTREMAANWVFTSVSSPKMTGDLLPLFGLEIGIVLGATEAPTWEKLIREEDQTSDIDKLPYANFLAGFSLKAINTSFELGIIPETGSDNVTISNFSLAAKVTFFDSEMFKAAARLHYASNELSFTDTINNSSTGNQNVTGKTEFNTKVWGLQALAGLDLVVFEPYVGLGFVRSSSDVKLQFSGAATIFDQTVALTAEGTAESDKTSAQFFTGFVLDLVIINLGFEYMRVHDTNKISGKFSFNI